MTHPTRRALLRAGAAIGALALATLPSPTPMPRRAARCA